ncbi:MAG: DUF3037 domain-containing protein [Betaproteobacteria bacterium]|nr:DUF3037 domain-containing protein [Betaproteobacteria bacterium]
MRKTACQYTIVRFAPFIETGEFANVGILMMAPKARYFDYMLLKTRRHGRITKFFEELDAKIFKSTMYALKDELGRVHSVLKAHGFDRRYKLNDVAFAQGMFAEILRPRETILRFSEPRAVLAEDPNKTLKELFAFYVERNFTIKEYRETELDRGIRDLLFQAQVGERYTREKVGNDEYFVTFPFVEMHAKTPFKIIKPLHLSQEDSSKILEHGGKWEFRVRELHKHHDLSPEKILFAVDGPDGKDSRAKAYQEAVDMLHDTGSNVQPYTRQEKILEFASKHSVH